MQPYQWKDWKTVDYDPQLAVRAKVLYEKYNTSLKAADELSLKIDQMKAVSAFTNDVNEKRRIQSEIDNSLNQMAQKEDYENRIGDIQRLATKYAKEYTPLEENYKRYTEYVDNFNKEFAKGTYNARQAQLFSSYALDRFGKKYEGIERDPITGEINEASYFSGPTIYKDPKITDKIINVLNTVKPITTGNQAGGGVYTFKDGQFNLQYDTPEGYKIEQVRPEDIKKATDLVIKDPEVSAYLDQLADMEANQMRISTGDSRTGASQYLGLFNDKKNELIAEQAKATDTQTKDAYQKAIDAVSAEILTLNTALATEDKSYQYLKNKSKQNLLEPIYGYAESRSGIKSIEEYKIEEGNLSDYAKAKKWMDENIGSKGISSVVPTSILSTKEKLSKIETNKAIIESLTAELANDPNLSESIRDSKLKTIQRLRIDNQIQEGQVRSSVLNNLDTRELSKQFKDETSYNRVISVLTKDNPNKDQFEILKDLRNIFDNTLDQDFIDFKNKFETEYGEGSFSGTFSKPFGAVAPADYRGFEIAMSRGENFEGYNYSPSKIINYIDSLYEKADLTETKQAFPVYYDKLPGLNPVQIKAGSEAASKFFSGYEIPENIEVLGITENDGGDPTFDKIPGSTLSGYKVSKWGFMEYGENGAWELTLTKSDAPNKTVILPTERLSNSALDAYTNSAGFKFTRLIDKMNNRSAGNIQEVVISTTSDLQKGAGTFKLEVKSNGSNPPHVRVTNLKTGNTTQFMSIEDPVISGISNDPNLVIDGKPIGEVIGELL